MKTVSMMLASVAILSACNAEQSNAAAKEPEAIAATVAAPANGDWSAIVTRTPEGGFLMGNPNAKVKLVEFGSLTCHVCADFEEQGGKALVDNYVKKGLVSWEFRNFVRDPFDMAASLLARCGGEAGFFGLTRNLFADQKIWVGKIQASDPAKVQALQTMEPVQQFSAIADLGGLKDYASMRGVPKDKAEQCLTDQAEITRLVQMNSDAASAYNLPGTPTFLINGAVADQAYSWGALEPRIKEALAS